MRVQPDALKASDHEELAAVGKGSTHGGMQPRMTRWPIQNCESFLAFADRDRDNLDFLKRWSSIGTLVRVASGIKSDDRRVQTVGHLAE